MTKVLPVLTVAELRFGIVLAVIALALALYWPTTSWLAAEWGTLGGNYSHGYLMVAAAVWLLWDRRASIAPLSPASHWLLLAPIAGTGFLWLVSWTASVITVQLVVLPLLLIFALAVCVGIRASMVVAPLILLLYFAMPIWDMINGPLQLLAAFAVEKLCALIGLPVFIEGTNVAVPNGRFSIQGGCSGLSFLLASLSITTFVALQSSFRGLVLAAWYAGTIGLALISNWIRIAVIVYVGNETRMTSEFVNDHYTFGWWVFAVVFGAAIWLTRRHFLFHSRRLGVPEARTTTPTHTSRAGSLALGASIVAFPIWAFAIDTLEKRSVAHSEFLTVADSWEIVTDGSETPWRPKFVNQDREQLRYTVADERSIWLYVASYDYQQQDKELINVNNRVFAPFKAVSEEDSVNAAGWPVRITRAIDPNRGERYVIAHTYFSFGEPVIRTQDVLTNQILGKLSGASSGEVVALATRCNADCDSAISILLSTAVADGEYTQ